MALAILSHPRFVRPDLRICGIVLVALCVLTALMLAVFVVNSRAEQAVLSLDNAFIFSVTAGDAAAPSQVKTPTQRVAPKPKAAPDVAAPKVAPEMAATKTPYETYKVAIPPAVKADAPKITVILTGFGLSTTQSRALLADAPAGLTLALSPYANTDMVAVVDTAQKQGQEIWLDVPATTDGIDGGPYALTADVSSDAVQRNLLQIMDRGTAYVGLLLPASISYPKDIVQTLMQGRGLAVATPPSPIFSDTLRAEILKAAQAGQSSIVVDLSRLSVTVLKEMAAAGEISLVPLSTHVKPDTQPIVANTEHSPSQHDLAPAPHYE